MVSLRTLLITENLPYPTFKGGDLRNWQNVNGLLHLGEVGIFGLCSNDTRCSKLPRPGLTFWRSSTDAGLAFPPPEDRKLKSRGWFLSPAEHPSDVYYSDVAAAEIDHIIAEFEPQVVVIERLWLHRYIDCVKRRGCRIVLDSHNVEAPLYRQIAGSIEGDDLPSRLARALSERTELIEQQAVRAVDQVWVCSDEDKEMMNALYRETAPIYVVPNGLDFEIYDAARRKSYPCPEGVDRSGRSIIFTATFGYLPNAKAANFLIEEMFPRLATGGENRQLLLVGGMPTREMTAAAAQDRRILVTAAVTDVRPYLAAASTMVVPVFEGGGTRYKILEAFAAGVPVVSTAMGAHGLEVRHGEHLLIAETAAEFADAVEQLWANEPLASKLTERALLQVKERYSWAVTDRCIKNAIHELGLWS